jgi:hypothetical protein
MVLSRMIFNSSGMTEVFSHNEKGGVIISEDNMG